jgi:hypothetical protein
MRKYTALMSQSPSAATKIQETFPHFKRDQTPENH